MIKDAEVNAAEEQKVRELTEARNQGDVLVHTTKKSLEEYGDKLDAPAKESIEGAIKDLEESLKGDDKADIDSKMSALSAAAQKLGEKMYADQAPEGAAAGAAGAGAGKLDARPPLRRQRHPVLGHPRGQLRLRHVSGDEHDGAKGHAQRLRNGCDGRGEHAGAAQGQRRGADLPGLEQQLQKRAGQVHQRSLQQLSRVRL